MENNHYLINRKMTEFYLAIKDGSYLQSISKGDYANYSHLFTILNIMEKNGLVRTEKKTRKRFIYLTERGRLIQNELFKLREVLK